MAEEMIAVIGEAPDSYNGNPWCFVPEVSAASGGRIVVVTHSVDNKYDVNGLEQQGFKLRRRQLMGHLRRALDDIPDTPRAIREAFSRMNSELESNILKGSSCEGGFWLCQYNSSVVVVGSGNVHVAGVSGAAVILSRAGKDIELTDRKLMRDIGVFRESVEKITDLCYYRKERLTEDDEFLTTCTRHTLVHVDGDFTPVLTTRVAAFGLVEAAKQIAGEYIDDPRTFVIVPLQGGAEMCIKQKAEADLNYLGAKKMLEEKLLALKMKAAEESEPGKLGWVNSTPLFPPIPDDEREKRKEQAMKELRDYYEEHPEDQGDIEGPCDSYPGLKPLENGQRQTPEPHTWCGGKTYRYSASIRVFFSPQHIRVIYAGLELDLLSVVEWKSGTGYLLEAMGLPKHPLANQLCKVAKAEGSILFFEAYGFYDLIPRESYPRKGDYRACVAADQKSFEALVAATDRLAYLDTYWGVSPRPLGFLGVR